MELNEGETQNMIRSRGQIMFKLEPCIKLTQLWVLFVTELLSKFNANINLPMSNKI